MDCKIVGIKWHAEVRRFLSRLESSYPRPLASCPPLPPPYPPPPTFLPLKPRPRLSRTLPATCTHISDVMGLSGSAGTHPSSISAPAGMFPTVPHAGEVLSVNTPRPEDPHSLGGGNIAHGTPPDGSFPSSRWPPGLQQAPMPLKRAPRKIPLWHPPTSLALSWTRLRLERVVGMRPWQPGRACPPCALLSSAMRTFRERRWMPALFTAFSRRCPHAPRGRALSAPAMIAPGFSASISTAPARRWRSLLA